MRAGTFAILLLFALVTQARADSSALDPAFGVGGRVSTNFGYITRMTGLHDAVIQSDGKIVLAGTVASDACCGAGFGIARLSPNGSPDPEFNGSGHSDLIVDASGFSSAYALALQPDGKIVAVGYSRVDPNDIVTVARYLPDGAADSTFNGSGKVTTPVPNTDAVATAVIVQPDGKIVVAASATAGSLLIRYQADGSLDTAFGSAGTGLVLITSFAVNPLFAPPDAYLSKTALALQPDGMLLVAGTGRATDNSALSFAVARFTSNGKLDPGFNGTGIAYTAVGSQDDRAHAMALQADGRIVVAGQALVSGAPDFALVRYNPNGALDASFGNSGKVITPIGAFADVANTVALLADGRIVVGGMSGAYEYSGTGHGIAMARYSANGVLDSTFAGTGIVNVPTSGTGLRGEFLAVQSNGRLIIGGTDDDQTFGALSRYLGDGSLDLAFGDGYGTVWLGGGATTDLAFALKARADGTLLAGGTSYGSFALAAYGADGALAWKRVIPGEWGAIEALIEQPDGQIVTAGWRRGESVTFTLFRFSSEGVLDATFNGSGRVDTLVNGRSSIASSALRQSDGAIIVAGYNSDASGSSIALARYNPDGSLDATFGVSGQVSTSIDAGAVALGLALQPDGKILASGSSYDGVRSRFAVARYLANGALDASFGSAGKVVLAMGASDAYAPGIAVQGDGRIVLAGVVTGNNVPVFALARLNADGSPDLSFGSEGKVLTSMGGDQYSGGVVSVALLPGGRILAAGSGAIAGTGTFALARYNADGSLDPTFGSGGRLHVPGNVYSVVVTSLVLQDANRAVLAGWVNDNDGPDFDLVRVFTDDTIPPDTSLTAMPGTESGQSVSFSFAGTDVGGTDVASFECSLDGGPFATCTSPASYVALGLGSHTFAVRARDGAGNVDPTPASYTWNVVPQPQTITFAEQPARVVSASPFTVSATGGGSGNPVVISSLTPGVCATSGTNGATITLLTAGTCTLAADQAGTPFFLAAPRVTRSFEVFASGFTLTVTHTGNGSGRVVSTPSGIDCGPTCDWTFAPSSSVTLVATPDPGSTFVSWIGPCSGNAPCNVQMDAAKSVGAAFLDVAAGHKIARLANLSTRGRVEAGENVMIGGFVIAGSTPKTVVIRAIGPSLADYGVAGVLANPQLQLVRQSDQAVIAANDDWGSAPNASTIQAAGFAPANPLESAIYISLQPGAYTAIVSGVGDGTGVGLVEVYEIDTPITQLINISTRGKVLTGFDVMIGGFVVGGSAPKTVVVRAIGPSLASHRIDGPLSNPQILVVRSTDQFLIGANDDWNYSPYAYAIQSNGLAPSDPLESALYLVLEPGSYTAIVSGSGGATGVGLVEVYAVGP